MTSPVDPLQEVEVAGTSADVAESIAPHTGRLQSEAMRASWWTAVQAIIGLPVSVLANLIVTRLLGPTEFGRVATYMAAYGLILTVLNGGISDATIQWGAAAHAKGDRKELLEIARKCAGYHMLVEGPAGALATAVLLHRESVATQCVGAAAVAITMMLGTTVVVMTAMSRNTILAKLNLIVGLATQLAVVTAAVQSHSAGPTWVARVLLGVLGPLLVVSAAPKEIRRASFHPLLPLGWPTGFARYSLRTLLAGIVASLVFSRSEILILDAYGDTLAAGLFALAAGLAVQITAPVDAMLGPLIPAAASLTAIGRDRANQAILRGIRLSTLITAPLSLIAIPVVAVLVPVVYGSRFGSAGTLFITLGIVSCLQSVLHPVTAFIAAVRKPFVVLAINAVALVLDLGLAIVLIPHIGAAGAVLANSVGQAASLALSVYVLRTEFAFDVRRGAIALRPFALIAASAAGGGTVRAAMPTAATLATRLLSPLGLISTKPQSRSEGGSDSARRSAPEQPKAQTEGDQRD